MNYRQVFTLPWSLTLNFKTFEARLFLTLKPLKPSNIHLKPSKTNQKNLKPTKNKISKKDLSPLIISSAQKDPPSTSRICLSLRFVNES